MQSRLTAVVLALLFLSLPLAAQKKKQQQPPRRTSQTHLLIVLDCSNSMWDTWQSEPKIKVTQQVLMRFIDSVDRRRDFDLALRVFGHKNDGSLASRLEVPFSDANYYRLQSKLRTLVPDGNCDATSALSEVAGDFAQHPNDRNIILMITDGVDECAGDVCEMAQQVQRDGIVTQIFILGIGQNSEAQRKQLSCAGRYTALASEERYTETLFDILRQASETARVVVNITGSDGMPYEMAIPIVFYDASTNLPRLTTIYTNTSQATADTLVIDPLLTYDVRLFTKPETTLTRQTFPAKELSAINMQLDQGRLSIRFDGQRTTWSVPNYEVVVRQHGQDATINRQRVGDRTSYLAGRYDVDVMTLPPTSLRDIEVRGDATTDLALPTPGMLTVSKPKVKQTASVFSLYGDRLSWVCDLDANTQNERIALMPGDYMLVVKPIANGTYSDVRTFRFSLKAAELKHISL